MIVAPPAFAQLSPEQQQQVHASSARLLFPELDDDVNESSPTQAEYDCTREGELKAIENALQKNLRVIRGSPHTLLLDLDDGKQMNGDMFQFLCKLLKEEPTKVSWKSKSGKGTHVLLYFERNTFTEGQALALEAILGSDPTRVLFGVVRERNGVTPSRLLFMPQPPEQAL